MSSSISRRRLLSLGMASGTAAIIAGLRPQVALTATGQQAASTGASPGRQNSSSTSAPGPKVSEKDSLAVALGYVADASRIDRSANPTYQAGASCSTCSWYQGKPGDAHGGACTFFPGKLVEPHGWCKMWNRKQ